MFSRVDILIFFDFLLIFSMVLIVFLLFLVIVICSVVCFLNFFDCFLFIRSKFGYRVDSFVINIKLFGFLLLSGVDFYFVVWEFYIIVIIYIFLIF